MPLFHACKHAIIMLMFYTCWNCFNIQSCLVGFLLIHELYAYDAMMLFALCYVFFDSMPLVAMYSCCSIFVSCPQHAIILTLLMYMLLCYKVAFCIDHIGLTLMPMNLNLNDIWIMLSVHGVHVKFMLIWFL